jgi:hypothetical protein
VLIGRRGRDEVPVEGMSDGTRDQLYLALRIAALEQHFRANGPMPVVADDLLINFDDRRAAAALRVLAELSHSRSDGLHPPSPLVELARATLEADLFCVHELQPLAPVRLAAA